MAYPADPVDVSNVADRYEGDLGKFRSTYVETLIADAQAAISSQLPEVAGYLAAGTLSAQMYVKTVAAMVLRVIRNPQGFIYQTAGDSAVSLSPQSDPGEVVLTASDRTSLVGSGAVAAFGTASIGLDRGWSAPSGWC